MPSPVTTAVEIAQPCESNSGRRNRSLEQLASRTRRAERMVSIRELRERGHLFKEVFQISQALILCGLPYQRTDVRQIARRARLAGGVIIQVTFTASIADIAMPYGSDRTLLHFLLDLAVKRNSSFVGWRSAQEFLEAMNMDCSSGKNRRDLRERFDRIRGLTISVKRSSGSVVDTAVMPIIRRATLPASIYVCDMNEGGCVLPPTTGAELGVEIGHDFFQELVCNHVPVPRAILQSTRKQSQLQDCMIFLYWRCYAAEESSRIPWALLRDQLWQDDKQLRRIRLRFKEAITALKVIWPEMQAAAERDFLLISKPLNGVYLDPEASRRRRNGKSNPPKADHAGR